MTCYECPVKSECPNCFGCKYNTLHWDDYPCNVCTASDVCFHTAMANKLPKERRGNYVPPQK